MAVRAKMRFWLVRLGKAVGICVGRLRLRMLVVLVRRCVDLHVEGQRDGNNSRAGKFKVVSSGGRYHLASKQASKAGRQARWQAGWIEKSMSLSLLHANSRARRVRGCGGSSSGRVGRDETGKPYSGQAKQAGEQTSDGDSRSIFSSAFVVPGSR